MKLHITLITGLIVAALACEDALDASIHQRLADGEFVARAGETLIAENKGNSELLFILQINDIRESRCPVSVVCVRFGEAVVTTQLRFEDQDQYAMARFMNVSSSVLSILRADLKSLRAFPGF